MIDEIQDIIQKRKNEDSKKAGHEDLTDEQLDKEIEETVIMLQEKKGLAGLRVTPNIHTGFSEKTERLLKEDLLYLLKEVLNRTDSTPFFTTEGKNL